MKNALVGLTLIALAVVGLGCSREPSKAEVKKGEEQMQKLETDMSKDLPAKVN